MFAVVGSIFSIASFSDANPAPGSSVEVRLFKPPGVGTGRGFIGNNLAYDAANDRLYATEGPSVLVFDNASTASGTVTPSRVIKPDGSDAYMSYLVFDKANDEIWLRGSQNSTDFVLKIANASTADGTVTPAKRFRTITSPNVLAIDTVRGRLYTSGSGRISVYDLRALKEPSEMPTPNTSNVPLHSVQGGTSAFALDAIRDRIYSLGSAFNTLTIVDGPSAGPGTVTTLPIPPAYGIAVDAANDRLYLGGYSSNALIFNNASTLTAGATAPATSVFAGVAAGSTTYSIWGFGFP